MSPALTLYDGEGRTSQKTSAIPLASASPHSPARPLTSSRLSHDRPRVCTRSRSPSIAPRRDRAAPVSSLAQMALTFSMTSRRQRLPRLDIFEEHRSTRSYRLPARDAGYARRSVVQQARPHILVSGTHRASPCQTGRPREARSHACSVSLRRARRRHLTAQPPCLRTGYGQ
ncbi:hypothetical protein C8Q78DRAFT_396320 [Trametes maxima]|nr:hypothetical protein C8Q78DRAFT_396320 [Trametes maxima]